MKPSDFYAHTERQANGCLTWTGNMYPLGYGRAWETGNQYKEVRAHRLAWAIEKGPIPKGLSVLHKCDNRACVSVEHLFLGTQADNVADMYAKRRNKNKSGEAHGKSKLGDEDVRRIREAHLFGARQVDLAAAHGVGQTTISTVTRRATRQHVG